mmetsp:Transcript_119656/g.333971  ORF Transcript_119656/g.333971 Transcript_119656/m.333971 type:complete len:353 (+) Transcript_119656:66-1124(+)
MDPRESWAQGSGRGSGRAAPAAEGPGGAGLRSGRRLGRVLPEVHRNEGDLALGRGDGPVLLGLVPLALEEGLAQGGEEPVADVGAHAHARGPVAVLFAQAWGGAVSPECLVQLLHLVPQHVLRRAGALLLARALLALVEPRVVLHGTLQVQAQLWGHCLPDALDGREVLAPPRCRQEVGKQPQERWRGRQGPRRLAAGLRPCGLLGGLLLLTAGLFVGLLGGKITDLTSFLVAPLLLTGVVIVLRKNLLQLLRLLPLLRFGVLILVLCSSFLRLLILLSLFLFCLLPRVARGVVVGGRHGLTDGVQRGHVDDLEAERGEPLAAAHDAEQELEARVAHSAQRKLLQLVGLPEH